MVCCVVMSVSPFSVCILFICAVDAVLLPTVTSKYARKRSNFHWGKPKIFAQTTRRFLEKNGEWYGDETGYSLVCTRPFSWTQTAICAREVKPNLDKMPLT